MYSEGPSEGESVTKNWPAPLKSSVVWQWLRKPWPWERVVTVAGGCPGGSVGMTQGLPACFLANAASTAGHHNKGSGLSQHLASFSGPWRHSQTPLYVCKHTQLCMRVDQGPPWESWPVIWQSLTIAVSRCLGSRAKQMDGPSGFG